MYVLASRAPLSLRFNTATCGSPTFTGSTIQMCAWHVAMEHIALRAHHSLSADQQPEYEEAAYGHDYRQPGQQAQSSGQGLQSPGVFADSADGMPAGMSFGRPTDSGGAIVPQRWQQDGQGYAVDSRYQQQWYARDAASSDAYDDGHNQSPQEQQAYESRSEAGSIGSQYRDNSSVAPDESWQQAGRFQRSDADQSGAAPGAQHGHSGYSVQSSAPDAVAPASSWQSAAAQRQRRQDNHSNDWGGRQADSDDW